MLSVVAVQVKCIQDAIKSKKSRFDFLGENIVLKKTVGIFITMNPGYAGRTELPENLKALFRYETNTVVLIDFSLNVKGATLIFISGRASVISSAKEGKSGSIYNLVKNK